MLFQQLSAIATASVGGRRESKTDKKKKKTGWATNNISFRKNPLALPWSQGEVSHRSLWADNADAISRLYAGTAALKGDFTRTGKRTRKGALDDGMNSLQRYYLNNFLDADRQEGMDLMVGYTNFTNIVDDDIEPASSTEAFDTTNLQAAARQALFGNILDGLNDKHRSDVKERLGEIGVAGGTTRGQNRQRHRQLNLRWLPGDLQTHLRSQASMDVAGTVSQSSSSTEFCSSAALEAIDRRAASDKPWWNVVDLSSDTESEEDVNAEGADVDSVALPPGIGNPTLTRGYLLGMFLAGVQAPLWVASAVVALLGLVFLPEIKRQSL
jgi:hypothetical protein